MASGNENSNSNGNGNGNGKDDNNNSNNDNSNQTQFQVLSSRANLQKERMKEPEYKAMFLEVLKRQRGLIKQNIGSVSSSSSVSTSTKTNTGTGTDTDTTASTSTSTTTSTSPQVYYQKEQEILKKLMDIERDAIMGAIVMGACAFATVRYLPRLGVRFFGGKSKYDAMKAADIESYHASPKAYFARSVISTAMEASFGFWALYKGYQMRLDQIVGDGNGNGNGSGYGFGYGYIGGGGGGGGGGKEKKDGNIKDTISNLPLIEGRSVICDSICDEWTKLIHYRVSKDFWRAVEEDEKGLTTSSSPSSSSISALEAHNKIQHGDFWKAVRQFGTSCGKRRRYEEMIRRKQEEMQGRGRGQGQGHSSDARAFPVIPPPGVPDNIMELTDEEISAMLDDKYQA